MKTKMWTQILLIGAAIVAWYTLQRWVLPALGVQT